MINIVKNSFTLYKKNKVKIIEKSNKRVNDTDKIIKTKNQNRCCD